MYWQNNSNNSASTRCFVWFLVYSYSWSFLYLLLLLLSLIPMVWIYFCCDVAQQLAYPLSCLCWYPREIYIQFVSQLSSILILFCALNHIRLIRNQEHTITFNLILNSFPEILFSPLKCLPIIDIIDTYTALSASKICFGQSFKFFLASSIPDLQ